MASFTDPAPRFGGYTLGVPETSHYPEVQDKEILAGYSPPPHKKGRTLKPGQGILPKGQTLARAADGTYVAYGSTAAAGGAAKGFLSERTDTGPAGATRPKGGNIYMSGVMRRSALVGLDQAGIDALNARVDSSADTLIF